MEKNNKLKKFILIIGIVIILLLVFPIIIFNVFKKDDKNNINVFTEPLGLIELENHNLTPKFDPNIYEYYVETTDNSIKASCDILATGCNTEIDLNGKDYYTHEIKNPSGKGIYKINIKHEKEDNKLDSIQNINGIPEEWTNKDVAFRVEMTNDGLFSYSFDGGKNWQDNNEIIIKNNGEYQVIVKRKDRTSFDIHTVVVDKIDKEAPQVSITKTATDNKVLLEILAYDGESGVGGIRFNNGEFLSNTQYEITKDGLYSVEVKDNLGNITETSIEVNKNDFNKQQTKTFNLTLDNNGVKLEKNLLTCTTSENSCEVTLPKIITKKTILGYGTSEDSQVAIYKEGQKVTLTSNLILYAITKETLTATFEKNGAEYISNNTAKCEIYNKQNSCIITMPSITRRGYTIIGWGATNSSVIASVSENKQITLTKNTKYYAITKKLVTATFEKNGATNISKSTDKCEIFNTNVSCNIKTPTIARDGFTIVGWGITENSKAALAESNKTIAVTQNIKYYAITKKLVTATFEKNGATNISKNIATCEIINKDNSCIITTPTVNRDGYTILGWATTKDSKISSVEVNKSLTLTKDMQYYAVTKKTLTAIFEKNGAKSISKVSDKCELYNNDISCTITTPTITRSSYTILGWGTTSSSKSSNVGVNKALTITKDTIYYAITNKNINVNFYGNGAIIDKNKVSCSIWNNASKCTVNLPTITRDGYTVLGFNADATSHSASDGWISGGKVEVDSTVSSNFYAITKSNTRYTATFKIQDMKATSTSETNKSCFRYNKETDCSITSPTLTSKSGYKALGWNTTKNSTSASLDSGKTTKLSANATFYSITYNEIPIKASFIIQDENAVSASSTIATCYRYNGSASCEITAPKLELKFNRYIILGWNQSKTATSASLASSDKKVISSNETYYSITYEKHVAVLSTGNIGYFNTNYCFDSGITTAYSSSCKYALIPCNAYNGGSCEVTLPNITPINNFMVEGWATTSNSSSVEIKMNNIATIDTVTKDYYPVAYKNLKVKFDKNGADSLGNCQATDAEGNCYATCKEYGSGGCEVSVPYVYNQGTDVSGFADNVDAQKGSYIPLKKMKIYENKTVYAVIKNVKIDDTYRIIKSQKYGNTVVETDETCSADVYNKYYEFLDSFYKKAPEMFVFAKMTFAGGEKFPGAGVTYNVYGYRSILVHCPSNFSDYYFRTIVHETAHAWESQYAVAIDGSLNALMEPYFNKYKAYAVENRPFRDYSFSGVGEFTADAYAWYYFMFIDDTYQTDGIKENLFYPSDLKQAMEKHIAFTKNGYK